MRLVTEDEPRGPLDLFRMLRENSKGFPAMWRGHSNGQVSERAVANGNRQVTYASIKVAVEEIAYPGLRPQYWRE
jgi:hypothetical protein